MNGAEALIETAIRAGIDICFANPGTTELPLMAAMDAVSGMHAVLCLFEGVCTGAADGYGRMSGRPALTLLHHGPGLANGIANLHNARRARTQLVNIIGEHMTWHRDANPPLATDIASLARPVSAWVHTASNSQSLAAEFADALSAACSCNGQVACLIVPMDCQQGAAAGPAALKPAQPPPQPSAERLAGARRVLRAGQPSAILLGGPHALSKRGLAAASRIAAASGCRLFCETFPARMERGAGFPVVEKLPYFPEQALESLSPFAHLILAGAGVPVAFFGYAGHPSRLVPRGTHQTVLADPEEDAVTALEELADDLDAPDRGPVASESRPARPNGELTPRSLGEAIAAVQPEGLIVVDEALTSGLPYFLASASAPPFTYLTLTGGSIGHGLPCAVGAALACPDRRVLAFEADGSGMYTVQALWTMARENLNITTVICSNRGYRILRLEMARAGITHPGPQSQGVTELSRPALDWVALARGMGVPGVRVETADAMVDQLGRVLNEAGPCLIEAII